MCHALAAQGNTNFNAAHGDLVGNILHSLQARGAESVDAASACGMGESSGKRGGADFVCSFGVADLRTQHVNHCTQRFDAL
jgi:hypothetical protein